VSVCVLVSVLIGVFQVGNLGLLFMLLFFIYAALGVELFGELGKRILLLFNSYPH